MSKKIKIVALGWYGATNIGDELLLSTLIQWAKESDGDVIAISLNPSDTINRHGIKAIDFHNLGEIATELITADLFILGGGGIFQDHHPFNIEALYDATKNDISAYARPFYMAKQFGLKTHIFAHGVGPLNGKNSRLVVKEIFSSADYVSVRDRSSLELLHSLDITRDIIVAPDPVWSHARQWVLNNKEAEFRPKLSHKRKKIGLVVRPWEFSSGWEDKLLSAIRELSDNAWEFIWIGFQNSSDFKKAQSDRDFLEKITSSFEEKIESTIIDATDINEVFNILNECDAVLSMRLHCSIIAITLGKPTVFLEYDQKMVHAHDMAEVPSSLRIGLEDSLLKYKETLKLVMSPDSQAWKIDTEKLELLSNDSLQHKFLLEKSVSACIKETSVSHGWSENNFDWMAAWMQQLIWQKASAINLSNKAHEILVYKDYLLCQKDADISMHEKNKEELEIKFKDLEKTINLSANDSINFQNALVEKNISIEKLSAKIEEVENHNKLLRIECEKINSDELLKNINTLNDKNLIIDLQKKIIDECQEKIKAISQENIQLNEKVKINRDYINEKEIYIATLIAHMEKEKIGAKMSSKINSIFLKNRYLGRSIYLLKNGGLPALFSAINAKRRNGKNTTVKAHLNQLDTSFLISNNSPSRQLTHQSVAKLRGEEIILISSKSFEWMQRNHRAAHLAVAALSAGHRVIYLYSPGALIVDSELQKNTTFPIPGLQCTNIQDIEPSIIFNDVSENCQIISFIKDSHALKILKFAKGRGIATSLDISVDMAYSNIGSDFDFPEEKNVLVDRFVVIRSAASHTTFDIYKSYPRPKVFKNTSKIKCLTVFPGLTNIFDWNKYISTAESNKNIDFFITGEKILNINTPSNIHWLGNNDINIAAHITHCDFIFYPYLEESLKYADSAQDIYAAIFLNKKVICTVDFNITESSNLLVTTEVNNIENYLNAYETPKSTDIFISKNSWLHRLESIILSKPRNDVSVVILIHNNENIISRCLETLIFHCSSYIKEIIVIDNASSDDGASLVEQYFPEVVLIRNPENGCSSGRNLGAQHCSGKYIAFFDSDQWFTGSSGFAEALSILEKHAGVGVTGWNAGWFDATRTDLGGMIADYCPNRGMNSDAIQNGYRTDVGFLGTSGFFMRKATFDATAGFDIFYDPTCFEDTDLCFQLKALGMDIAYRDLSGIRHQPHQTTGADTNSERYQKLFSRNASYFKKKWEKYPHFFMDYSD